MKLLYMKVFLFGGGGQNSIYHNGGGVKMKKMKIYRGSHQKIQRSEKFLHSPPLINNDRSFSARRLYPRIQPG